MVLDKKDLSADQRRRVDRLFKMINHTGLDATKVLDSMAFEPFLYIYVENGECSGSTVISYLIQYDKINNGVFQPNKKTHMEA